MNKTKAHLVLSSVLCCTLAGCAASATVKPGRAIAPTSRPALSANSLVPLDRIVPAKPLPATRASTRPASSAPLEALQLFAQARAAVSSGQRFTAVQLIEQALAIDPESYELNFAMGQYSQGTALARRAMPSLQKAAEIEPDHAELYLEMARLQVGEGKGPEALRSLRMAQQTSAYKSGAEVCLAIDYFLARTLQLSGYDSASLRCYETLLDRMPRISQSYRGPAEVVQIVRNPDIVLSEIATLAGRLGDYPTALGAIEQAMLQSPTNQQYAIARLRLLQQAGLAGEARAFLPEIISRFGMGVETMSLLSELYKGPGGGDAQALLDMRRALAARKNDANLAFAIADLQVRSGNADGAKATLTEIAAQLDYRQDTVAHLVDFHESLGQTVKAAEVLVDASARRPEQLTDIASRMSKLSRLSRSNHLRLRDLQQMQVESWAEAARLYWVARLAELWDRDELARAALEKAVRQPRAYAPAYRELQTHYWNRRDWDFERKNKAAAELVDLALLHGEKALAAELRGLGALRLGRDAEASAALLESMREGDAAPETLLAYASVQIRQKNAREAERTLLRINEEFPLFDPAYELLIAFYRESGSATGTFKTLQRWLAADPRNPTARLLQGTLMYLAKRVDASEKIFLDLFDEYADNPEVLIAMQRLYFETGRLDKFITLLEQKRQGRPDIREIAARLADIYAQEQRMGDAMRVLDDLRKSAAGDSDLLYYVSSLYLRADDAKTAEAVLEDVLKIDPTHSAACNDLGYYMADEGRDLDRAERLIRIAVAAEPDNQAFLDSLGWALYKRGLFEQAREYLERAVAQTINADPVVLDHLGDAYYRLGRAGDAAKRWEDAASRLVTLPAMSRELKDKLTVLQEKLQSHRQGRPVKVAPLASEQNK